MSRPIYTVRHVETSALLPKVLTRGRAYFVDDEQYIVIDHGHGPVIYGNRPGPQGPAGEPQPMLQAQIDELAEASLTTLDTIKKINDRRKSDNEALASDLDAKEAELKESIIRAHTELQQAVQNSEQHLETLIADRFDLVQGMSEDNAQALLELLNSIAKKFTLYDSAISTLTKAISNLYPETHQDTQEGLNEAGISSGQIILNNGRAYIVDRAEYDQSGGTVSLMFYDMGESDDLVAGLDVGDTVTYDGNPWTVSELAGNEFEGVITLSLTKQD